MSSEEMCQVCPAIVCVSESGTVLGARDTSVKGVLLAFKQDRMLGDSRRVCPVHCGEETGQVSVQRGPGAPYASLHSAPWSQRCHADKLSIFHLPNSTSSFNS